MKTTWIVQENFGTASLTYQKLQEACEEADVPIIGVHITPFDYDLSHIPTVEGPIVLYGGTTMIMGAMQDERLRRGVFFDPEKFQPSQYQEHFGKFYLNDDARLATMREFSLEDHALSDSFFIRPNDDFKNFTGEVMTFEDYLSWYNVILNRSEEGDSISPETVICIATEKRIVKEYRLFVVDGVPISGSQYKPVQGTLPFIPFDRLIKEATKNWQPAPVYVMDFSQNWDIVKIIECNCFNGSGFYLSDVPAIVRAVSAYQEANFSISSSAV